MWHRCWRPTGRQRVGILDIATYPLTRGPVDGLPRAGPDRKRLSIRVRERDYAAARRYLADEGFYYEDPVYRFDSPDQLIRYFEMMGPIIGSVELLKQFVDGDDVCTILCFSAQLSEKTTAMTVQWAQVRGDKIARIYGIYDAHEQKKLSEVD